MMMATGTMRTRKSPYESGAMVCVFRRGLFVVALLATILSGCGREAWQRDPEVGAEETLRAALSKPMGIERAEGLVAAMSGLDPETARRLAEVMTNWNEPVPAYEIRLLYVTWADRDPDAALASVLAMDPATGHRKGVGAAIVRSLAAREPSRIRQWVTSLSGDEPQDFRTAMAVALVEGWPAVRLGYEGISDLIENMPLGFERERATRALVTGLIEAGRMEQVMRWAESIPLDAPGQFRGMVFRKIAVIGGEESPKRIAAWLDRHRTERYGQAGLRVLARVWAENDPEEALGWALSQPDDRGRFLSVKFAYQAFYDQDREGAIAWLAAQADSTALDGARISQALSEMYVDPEAATRAALEIGDPGTRDDILGKVVRYWASQDVDAAKSWIDASGFPRAYWNELLKPKRPRPRATRRPGRAGQAGVTDEVKS